MATKFTHLVELDLSQSISHSFYPGFIDFDLYVITNGLRMLDLQNSEVPQCSIMPLELIHHCRFMELSDSN
ncbi:hypothetical protein QN277_003865 [Acacia crassicarpa]|uniref:Uncharacterized protein n=1 Tax=Acacia crassicarpa TaxID=499986 RepID=A0AAE1JWS8_9FABA|nr:hypothetical protein QN277_003865 [Acacia crassicarpa]